MELDFDAVQKASVQSGGGVGMNGILEQIKVIAVQAGEEILAIYDQGFDVNYKEDGSPLTLADQKAHNLIVRELQALDATIPILSEESENISYIDRQHWSKFWIVDPLDGTKEFIKGNGEFTVNIALIDKATPVLGVVHTPVKKITHSAIKGGKAHKQQAGLASQEIQVRQLPEANVCVVASRSHCGAQVKQYIDNLKKQTKDVEIMNMGSSLKICLVAEGQADIYPRLGPTSEWDTAAAQCILEVAGGSMTDCVGQPLCYNKSDILNPWFLAGGDRNMDWTRFVSQTGDEKE